MNPDFLAWIILFLPLFAAVVITLFTKHDRELSAGLSIGAVVAGFILSVVFISWAGWSPARPESAVTWLTVISGVVLPRGRGPRCFWNCDLTGGFPEAG